MTKLFEAYARDGVIVIPERVAQPARCLVAVLDDNLEGLRADAEYTIPETRQKRMSELLQKIRDNSLTDSERRELDALAVEFDVATLRRGRALGILAQVDAVTSST